LAGKGGGDEELSAKQRGETHQQQRGKRETGLGPQRALPDNYLKEPDTKGAHMLAINGLTWGEKNPLRVKGRNIFVNVG